MFGIKKKRSEKIPDYIFLITAGLLVVFGLVMLSSASSDLGKIKFNDTYYYLRHQIYYGLSLGIAGFLICYFIPYKKWNRAAPYLLGIGILALIAVFTPLGFRAGGASRWINLGPLSVQPAEFLKFAFIIYVAAWLTGKKANRQASFVEGFLPFLAISGFVALLIFLQPATTAVVIIMFSALVIYFMSGARFKYIVGAILLGAVALLIFISVTPYRRERVLSYLRNDQVNILSSGYHRNQALIAIGSGGIMGVGYGQSTAKYKFLPEPIGDSIFAVIAEEFGFAGSIFVLALFLLLAIKGFFIANRVRDNFGKLVVVGFISVIMLQAFINIGAISGVLPLTGVPLPFISYGGTALAIFMSMIGVIANISKYS